MRTVEQLENDRVAVFWRWFAAAAEEIEDQIRNSGHLHSWIAKIDQQVNLMSADLGWEIGPCEEDGSLFFALSPRGKSEFLKLTSEIVLRAPNLAGWKFLPARPPKDWLDRCLVLHLPAGTLSVDFEGWLFGLHRQTQECIATVLPGQELPTLTQDELEGLVWLFLECELGEEQVLRHINKVEILHRSPRNKKLVPSHQLRGLFASIMQ